MDAVLIFIIDLDGPTKLAPVLGEILHWMVANIPGNATNFALKGDTLVHYYPPGPPICKKKTLKFLKAGSLKIILKF
jgi:hypothetical protein